MLWVMKEEKDSGVDCYDTKHQREMHKSPNQVGLVNHLKSPTAALAKALKCLEQVGVLRLQRVNGELRGSSSPAFAFG